MRLLIRQSIDDSSNGKDSRLPAARRSTNFGEKSESRLSSSSAESSMMSFSMRSIGILDRIGLPSLIRSAESDGGGGQGFIIALAKCPDPAPKSTTVLNRRFMSLNQFASMKEIP